MRAFRGLNSLKNSCLSQPESRFWCITVGINHPTTTTCSCWETNLGIPLDVALLGDWFKEQLSVHAAEWYTRFLSPIAVGTNLETIPSEFVALLLEHSQGRIQYAQTNDQRQILQELITLHREDPDFGTTAADEAFRTIKREIRLAQETSSKAERLWSRVAPGAENSQARRSGNRPRAWKKMGKAQAAVFALEAACNPRGIVGYARSAAQNVLQAAVCDFLADNYATGITDRNRAMEQLKKATINSQANILLTLLGNAPLAEEEKTDHNT